MNRESWLKKLPVPLLATMVGAATLSNVYGGLGYTWIRHITMAAAFVVLLCFAARIITQRDIFIEEYRTTVPASLYAGFTMLLMLLGAYCQEYFGGIGKVMWFAGLILHAVHIVIFTCRNVLTGRKWDTFVPSWFVTYNGIMVSCVVGGIMKEPAILQIVTVYGIVIYFILIPIMLWRLIKHEIKSGMYHTQAIVLAPCSLCLVSYLNTAANPLQILVTILYLCVLASLLFILYKLPAFFSYAFYPGFAGLTFPMAIGIVASTKMAAYLEQMGNTALAGAVRQISGIQIYITTAIIGYVLFQFIKMLVKDNK